MLLIIMSHNMKYLHIFAYMFVIKKKIPNSICFENEKKK